MHNRKLYLSGVICAMVMAVGLIVIKFIFQVNVTEMISQLKDFTPPETWGLLYLDSANS